MGPGVLVFIEQRSGRVHPASLQLFALATRLADAAGGDVSAAILGHGVGHLAEIAGRYGARNVHMIDDAALALYRAQPYARALVAAIERAEPQAVLLATTFLGRDLAPRAAVRAGAALATDCVDIATEDGALLVRRSMYGGKCVGQFRLESDRLRIVSVRPNSYVAPDPHGKATPSVEMLSLDIPAEDQKTRVLDVVRTGGEVKDVTEADIVVSGGRSLKSEENFRIIYELADVLEGAVGASRAAVDAGYQPHSRQVGLTGKVVTPKLYIACGIDGAIQHLAGMRGSKIIVAINTKRDAPIFDVATYGVAADVFTMVPLLTEEIRRLKASEQTAAGGDA